MAELCLVDLLSCALEDELVLDSDRVTGWLIHLSHEVDLRHHVTLIPCIKDCTV